jgi:hypothetical protein
MQRFLQVLTTPIEIVTELKSMGVEIQMIQPAPIFRQCLEPIKRGIASIFPIKKSNHRESIFLEAIFDIVHPIMVKNMRHTGSGSIHYVVRIINLVSGRMAEAGEQQACGEHFEELK